MITIENIKGNYNLIGMWYLLSLPDGRADKVFYASNHDLKYVLDWSDTCNYFSGAFRDGTLIGVGFAENALKDGIINRAEVGFGFLPNCTVLEASSAGKSLLTDCFEKLEVDDIFGTTPQENITAVAFIKRLGLKVYGPVPNFCTYLGKKSGVYTSHITREEWKQQNSKQ